LSLRLSTASLYSLLTSIFFGSLLIQSNLFQLQNTAKLFACQRTLRAFVTGSNHFLFSLIFSIALHTLIVLFIDRLVKTADSTTSFAASDAFNSSSNSSFFFFNSSLKSSLSAKSE
jgi:hypothetical protein